MVQQGSGLTISTYTTPKFLSSANTINPAPVNPIATDTETLPRIFPDVFARKTFLDWFGHL